MRFGSQKDDRPIVEMTYLIKLETLCGCQRVLSLGISAPMNGAPEQWYSPINMPTPSIDLAKVYGHAPMIVRRFNYVRTDVTKDATVYVYHEMDTGVVLEEYKVTEKK